MLLFLREDEHGWVLEPHGIEEDCWETTPEGSAQIKSAGWSAYRMHRVSRHVMDMLLIDGLISPAFRSRETPSPHRENQSGSSAT